MYIRGVAGDPKQSRQLGGQRWRAGRAWLAALGALLLLLAALGCGGAAQTMPAAQWRGRLREAMLQRVDTRAQRDSHSRLLLQAVEEGALEGLNRGQVRAAFGAGRSCASFDICADQGFGANDWHYELGQMGDKEKVKVLPVLLVGFDHKDRVVRVWTRTTH